MTIKVFRKGASEQGFRHQHRLEADLTPQTGEEAEFLDRVRFEFHASSAGSGISCFRIEVTSEDFERLAQAMMNVDPGAAIKAFGAAMVQGQQQPTDALFDINGDLIE